MARKTMTPKRLLLTLALVLIAAALRSYLAPGPENGDQRPDGGLTVEEAAAGHLSEVMIDAEGVVRRVLADDNEGSRHQRFILELPSGHTVLVAHNIDLAPRVPLQNGDPVAVHGQYEWTSQGGVLHWTHHDPSNRHEWGWIMHQGKKYQ